MHTIATDEHGRRYLAGSPSASRPQLALEASADPAAPLPTPRAMVGMDHFALELGSYAGTAHPAAAVSAAALIGVNAGPNFTVNGSLATLLWLAILRRSGVAIGARRFAAVGLLATPVALAAAALCAR